MGLKRILIFSNESKKYFKNFVASMPKIMKKVVKSESGNYKIVKVFKKFFLVILT